MRAELIALGIVPDFGTPSPPCGIYDNRAKGSILYVCDFWRNVGDGSKDKQDWRFFSFPGPYNHADEFRLHSRLLFLFVLQRIVPGGYVWVSVIKFNRFTFRLLVFSLEAITALQRLPGDT